MADILGRIFGVVLTLAIVLPPIIFLFIIFKKFDVDNDGLDDY